MYVYRDVCTHMAHAPQTVAHLLRRTLSPNVHVSLIVNVFKEGGFILTCIYIYMI